jgi:hypothetical protein
MDSSNPVTGRPALPTVPAARDDVWRGTFTPPGPARPNSGRERFRRSLPQVLREPLSRAAWRAAWRAGEFAALGLLLAIPGFVFIVVAVTFGFWMSLSIVGMVVGLPLLVVSLLGPGGSASSTAAWPTGCWGSRSRRRRRCARSLAPWAGPGRS